MPLQKIFNFFYLVLLIILFWMVSVMAFGQQVRYGAKAGFSVNQFQQPGSTIGYHAGMFSQLVVADFADVRLELLYSLLGGGRQSYENRFSQVFEKFPNVEKVVHVNPSLKLHSVEVPLLFELCSPDMRLDEVQAVVILGGAYNFIFAARENFIRQYHFKSGDIFNEAYQVENVGRFYRQHLFSAIAGVGLNFNMEGRLVKLELRYRHGLTQLNQNMVAIPETGGELQSSSFNIGISTTLN